MFVLKHKESKKYLFLLIIVFSVIIFKNPIIILSIVLPIFIFYKKFKYLSNFKWLFRFLIFKLILVLFISISYQKLNITRIMNLYPDQYFYLKSIDSIYMELKSNMFFLDFNKHVETFNRFYNIIVSYLVYINGGNTQLVISSFNHFILFLISLNSVHLYNSLSNSKKYDVLVFMAIYYMPSLNIFSVLLLRDIFISFLITLFFRFLIEERLLENSIILIFTYWTRRHLTFIFVILLILNLISKIWTKNKKKFSKNLQYFIQILLIIFIVIAPILIVSRNDKLKYILFKFKFANLPKFLNSFILGFFSIEFLKESGTNLNKVNILLSRLITPELILLPMSFVVLLIKYIKIVPFKIKLVAYYLFICLLIYTYGYFVHGTITSRYYFIYYPVIFSIMTSMLNYRICTLSFQTVIDKSKKENLYQKK